jgi:hypothetical protein
MRETPNVGVCSRVRAVEGGTMDFSERLDTLQQRVTAAETAAQAATAESRENLKQRIARTQDDVDRASKNAQQQADQAAGTARSKWAQLKADAAAKREDVKAKIDERTRQMDARVADDDANWAEADAADALDFAAWAVDNAQLSILDAIDARAYADELTRTVRS